MRLAITALALCLCIASTVLAATPTIIKPANGTTIAPGQKFPFVYQSIAEKGCSSYSIHVWLLTRPLTSLIAGENFAAGHYFGRFDIANWPALPHAHHPAPSHLTMPNFAKNPPGWGAGEHASNVKCYLAVLEEYATGNGTIGNRMSLTYNLVRYNATRHSNV